MSVKVNTHMADMSVTADVSQVPMGWLKTVASINLSNEDAISVETVRVRASGRTSIRRSRSIPT